MFYSSAKWLWLRDYVLQRDGHVCQMCGALLGEGRSNAEDTVVRPFVADHLIPHRGDRLLFFAKWNVWAVCCDCHDGPCHSIEAGFKGALTPAQQRLIRDEKLQYRFILLDGTSRTPTVREVVLEPKET